MLVVTRKPDESIVFPSLGVTVRVVRVAGQIVRIGVEAPPEIRVFRGELADAAATAPPAMTHARRNLLNRLSLAIHLARQQCAAGAARDAEATLAGAIDARTQVDNAVARRSDRPAMRALIVEDDSNERSLLAGILRMKGCECATAADGQDALEYLDTHDRPDVVLLDMIMPRCDGPETLRRIRDDRRWQGLRVYSVSGTDPRDLGLPIGPHGIDGWFAKPLDPQKVWSAITN